MLSRLKGPFFQKTLFITPSCPLRCLGCSLPEHENNTDELIAKTSHFSHPTWLNLVGGEPTSFDALPELISFLKKKGFYLRLWTNGSHPEANHQPLFSSVDEVGLYLPRLTHASFRFHTGRDLFESTYRTLEQIQKRPLIISHTVSFESFSSLPDLHEKAHALKALLYLIVPPDTGLSPEQHLYVRRYRHVKNVAVFEQKTPSHYCHGFPETDFSGRDVTAFSAAEGFFRLKTLLANKGKLYPLRRPLLKPQRRECHH